MVLVLAWLLPLKPAPITTPALPVLSPWRRCAINTYAPSKGATTCLSCCKGTTTVAAKTCFLWTRGQAGASKCTAIRSAKRLA